MDCIFGATGVLTDFLWAVFFGGAAFRAVFLAAAGAAFTAADFFAANRFRNAAKMFALPAAESLRFDLTGSGVAIDPAASVVPLMAAHRFCCPRAIRRRAAAETLRFCGAASGVAAVSVGPPGSIARRSAIWASM